MLLGPALCRAFFFARSYGGSSMALSATLNLASPRTKQEADAMALKLFCLLAFLLVGLITAGVL
jgi:hypothetical protein